MDLQHLGAHAGDYKTLAVYPLMKGERQFGALALYSQTLTSYSEAQLRTLERVASLTSDALHNAMLYAETRAITLTDPLTGLANSRFLHTVFDQEQARRAGDEHALTLLTMNLDGFKQINATLGHKLGDQIIKELGELIRGQLRREDTLIRYAGDEFMALLCNTPMETVSEIAVRIQTAVAEHLPVVLEGSNLRLGVSIGQARLGEDGRTLEQLLEAAETRLQSDKAARRLCASTVPMIRTWALSKVGVGQRTLKDREGCYHLQGFVDWPALLTCS